MRKLTLGLVGALALAGVGCARDSLDWARTAIEERTGLVDVEVYGHQSNGVCRDLYPEYPQTYLFRGRNTINLIVEGKACCNDQHKFKTPFLWE